MTPIYQNTYSFINDFPALLESVPDPPEADDELFQMSSAKGTCKVMCFHPKSNVTIALMKTCEIKEVVKRLVTLEQIVSSAHAFEKLNTLQNATGGSSRCWNWVRNGCGYRYSRTEVL